MKQSSDQLITENARLRRLVEQEQAENRGIQRIARSRLGRLILPWARPLIRALGRQRHDHWLAPGQLALWSRADQNGQLTAATGAVMADAQGGEGALHGAPNVLAICHPDWRGVRSSVENLFDQRLFVRDDLDQSRAEQVAAWIVAQAPRTVIFNGFPASHGLLVPALRRRAPNTRLMAIWHGSFMQLEEPAEWRGLNDLITAARDGAFVKLGFVKEGMAEVASRLGVHAQFIMNYVRQTPHAASQADPGGPHLGLWAVEPIWRKLPYTMLAASSLVPGARVWAAGQNRRAVDLAELLGVNLEQLTGGAIPQNDMPRVLAAMHVNLYVTLSECAPMLPLESLAVGAPCLIGPNSHYFRDHEALRRWLVVPYPDNPTVIRDCLSQAIADRDAIIAAYRPYAAAYRSEAEAHLGRFLD